MGTWGFGSFENDDALDWVDELVVSRGVGLLEQTFNAVIQGDYVEADVAASAVAAADVVTGLLGAPGQDFPESVLAWLDRNATTPSQALVDQAIAVVGRIQSPTCELLDLWEASGELDSWRAVLSSLVERLKNARS